MIDWPCHRRVAHGPHLSHCMDHPADQPDPVPFARCPNCVECPGVRAHPATMIGRPAKASQTDKEPRSLPIHRTEAGYPRCSTCDGGGCLDCTDPA